MWGARAWHTATLLPNRQVLFTGGDKRYHQVVLLRNGKVFVAGGESIRRDAFVWLREAELYDPLSKHFTSTAKMTTGLAQFGLGTLRDGRVTAVGSDDYVIKRGIFPGTAEIYVP